MVHTYSDTWSLEEFFEGGSDSEGFATHLHSTAKNIDAFRVVSKVL